MVQRCGRARGRRAAANLAALLAWGPLAGCTFDPSVPGHPKTEIPMVICDTQATSCSVAERNKFALVAYFGDSEFIDTSLAGAVTEGQAIAGAGCQFSGVVKIPAIFSSGRLLALDEEEWVADCSPGEELFFWDETEGRIFIHGTAVFRRGQDGCVIRTANFCS